VTIALHQRLADVPRVIYEISRVLKVVLPKPRFA
jgi:hypothetical protein